MSQKGLSLLEILVATILLSLVLSGLGNLFVATKRLTAHERSRVTSSEVGKRCLEYLHNEVRQSDWGATCLSTNNNPNPNCDGLSWCTTWWDSSSATSFFVGCITSPHPSLSNVRKTVVTLQWKERRAQSP